MPGAATAFGAALLVLALGAAPVAAGSDTGEPLTGFHREWVWSVPALPGAHALDAVDVDGDGRLELLTLQRFAHPFGGIWHQTRFDGELRQTWSSLPSAEPVRFVLVGSAAGRTEIAVGTTSRIEVLDGRSKALRRVISTPTEEILAGTLADLDGSPGLELAVCGADGLYLHDFASGDLLAARYGFTCTAIDSGQADGDAPLELALAGNPMGGFLLDGASLAVEWADLSGFGERVRFVDADGDGDEDLVCGFAASNDLRAVEPFTGVHFWLRLIGYQQTGEIEAADVDGGAGREVLVADPENGRILVLAASTGQVLWSILEPGGEPRGLAVGDFDQDGYLELAWTTSRSNLGEIAVADADTHEVLARTWSFRGHFPGLVRGDTDADGDLDLVTATSQSDDDLLSGGRILRFAASSHVLEYVGPQIPEQGYHGAIQSLTSAQLDADGSREICLATSIEYDQGAIRCLDGVTSALEWEVALPDYQVAYSVSTADLDGDGDRELLAGLSSATVLAFEGDSGQTFWAALSIPGYDTFNLLRVGNVTGDSALEVVAGSSPGGGVVILDAASGALVAGPFAAELGGLDLTQLEPDEPQEIVIGGDFGSVFRLDPTTGEKIQLSAQFADDVRCLRAADVTRDQVIDLVAVAGDRIQVWGGAEQAILWTSPHLGWEACADDTFWVENLDADAVPEIAVNMLSGIAMFEAPLAAVFADGFEAGDTSAWSSTVP